MIKWNRHSYNMPKYDFLLILIVLIMLCIFCGLFFSIGLPCLMISRTCALIGISDPATFVICACRLVLKLILTRLSRVNILLNPISQALQISRAGMGRASWRSGCSIGADAVNFVRAGADYSGLDLLEPGLDIARTRFRILEPCLGRYLLIKARSVCFSYQFVK